MRWCGRPGERLPFAATISHSKSATSTRSSRAIESSQNFNLVDVGALFFAGPLGLAVTKGFNFASIFQSSGGSSQIRTLVSEWHIERGVAQAQGCGHGDERESGRSEGRVGFRQWAFQGSDGSADRRTGMRQGAAENSRSIRQTGSGKAERPRHRLPGRRSGCSGKPSGFSAGSAMCSTPARSHRHISVAATALNLLGGTAPRVGE